MKVYPADRRPAPRGWRRARTAHEAIALLETGRVTEISLDHDLGVFVEGREETGHDLLKWLEREVAEGRTEPPEKMAVHSANASAYTPIGAGDRVDPAVCGTLEDPGAIGADRPFVVSYDSASLPDSPNGVGNVSLDFDRVEALCL